LENYESSEFIKYATTRKLTRDEFFLQDYNPESILSRLEDEPAVNKIKGYPYYLTEFSKLLSKKLFNKI